MNKNLINIKIYLQHLLDSTISERELTQLVQISRAIIQSYLIHIRTSLCYLCNFHGLTITDLAYDCIAEAFMKDGKNKFAQLSNFSDSLNNKIDGLPESEIFLAYKSFITRIADAQLARLYAQADPSGAKIHRNIRDSIDKSPYFQLDRDSRGLTLNLRDNDSLNTLASFPMEDLERELISRMDHSSSTKDLLKILYETLMDQNEFRRSITLVELVQVFKKVYKQDFEIDEFHNDEFSGTNFTEFEIENIRSQVELVLKEKILITYFARGKLERKQAETIFNAFQDIMYDWCNTGELQTSMLEYLQEYLPVDAETYETQYRTKMEYLLKLTRDEFRARLIREL
jgi:hypothetical protein